MPKIERAALCIAEVDRSTAAASKKIAGWASTYDNADRYGRIMKLGAFGSTLGGQAHSGMNLTSFKLPMLGYHEDEKPVGGSDMQPKAEYGMRHESGLAETDFGRDMAALIAAGAVPATSIGWDPNTAIITINADGMREYSYIDIMENSLCPCPANPLAILDAASMAGSGAAPAWEKEVAQWVKDLWPDFARLQFREPEVIDLRHTAAARETAATKGEKVALQAAHDAIIEAGASCDVAGDEGVASWDPEYRNALPDSAFAVVVAGGTKDPAGLTVPRSLRKLAIRDADGNLDRAQVRAGLTKVERAQLDDTHRVIAKKALAAAAGEVGIEAREVAALIFGGREVAAVAGSYEELIDILRQALNAAYPGQYPWIRATYPDTVVYELDAALNSSLGAPEPGTYQVTYLIDPTDGDVEFGSPVEVMLKDVVIPIPEDNDVDDQGLAALEIEAQELEAEAIAIG